MMRYFWVIFKHSVLAILVKRSGNADFLSTPFLQFLWIFHIRLCSKFLDSATASAGSIRHPSATKSYVEILNPFFFLEKVPSSPFFDSWISVLLLQLRGGGLPTSPNLGKKKSPSSPPEMQYEDAFLGIRSTTSSSSSGPLGTHEETSKIRLCFRM